MPDKKRVQELYGDAYKIVKRKGTEVELSKLKKGEAVCMGDGKTYHWLLIKKIH